MKNYQLIQFLPGLVGLRLGLVNKLHGRIIEMQVNG